MKERIIVGISGASGFIYGYRALQMLNKTDLEIHLVVSEAALLTGQIECGLAPEDLNPLAHKIYDIKDIGSAIASGSYKSQGMLIAPCSARTLSAVASGNCGNLLTRAADVILKERRRLVLMFRESPLHAGHIANMQAVTTMGGIICPPVPSFYHKPTTIDDLVNFSVGRALDLLGIETDIPRWGE